MKAAGLQSTRRKRVRGLGKWRRRWVQWEKVSCTGSNRGPQAEERGTTWRVPRKDIRRGLRTVARSGSNEARLRRCFTPARQPRLTLTAPPSCANLHRASTRPLPLRHRHSRRLVSLHQLLFASRRVQLDPAAERRALCPTGLLQLLLVLPHPSLFALLRVFACQLAATHQRDRDETRQHGLAEPA